MIVTAAAAASALIVLMELPIPSLWEPLAACGALVAVSFLWQPNLLRGLATLVGFSAAFTILMEAIAATGMPLVDHWLLAADAALGLSAPATVALIAQYPALALFFKLAYFSAIPQTAILLLISAEQATLWLFLRRFMLAALFTVCCFYFAPAEGVSTSVTPGIAERFHALRAGADLDWQRAEGIITFPSFHTAWALLLIASFWHTRLRWPVLAMNVAMIASTVTTGGHYYVDVLAGAVVAAVVLRQPCTIHARLPRTIDLKAIFGRVRRLRIPLP